MPALDPGIAGSQEAQRGLGQDDKLIGPRTINQRSESRLLAPANGHLKDGLVITVAPISIGARYLFVDLPRAPAYLVNLNVLARIRGA